MYELLLRVALGLQLLVDIGALRVVLGAIDDGLLLAKFLLEELALLHESLVLLFQLECSVHRAIRFLTITLQPAKRRHHMQSSTTGHETT